MDFLINLDGDCYVKVYLQTIATIGLAQIINILHLVKRIDYISQLIMNHWLVLLRIFECETLYIHNCFFC